MNKYTKTAYIIVDYQWDFLPGGALGVASGLDILRALLAGAKADFIDYVYASMDFHGENHCSFVRNGGIWVDHCKRGTRGVQLHPEVEALDPIVVHKAFEDDVDVYGADGGFVVNQDGSYGNGLVEDLHEKQVEAVVVVGIATDYCVKATVLGLLAAGFVVYVKLDAIAAVNVNEGDAEKAIEEMRAAGAIFI